MATIIKVCTWHSSANIGNVTSADALVNLIVKGFGFFLQTFFKR
jgi:hypothetical protein